MTLVARSDGQCEGTTTLHLCRPASVYFRQVRHCPTCDRRRRFVVLDAAWYGGTWTCCACGDSWADGERLPRPFARAWRVKATTKARQHWRTALNRREHRKWLASQVEFEDTP